MKVPTGKALTPLLRILVCMPLWLGLLTAPCAKADEAQTEIIYSTRAAELAPVLAPFAEPEGSVSAYQDQLIIRATPAKLATILDTLKKIDRPLKNLRISVRRQQQGSSSRKTIGANGQVHIRNGDVSAGISARADEENEQSQGSGRYSISALEGATVFIATGSDIPVLTVSSTRNGTVTGNGYVPVESGMQVTPRLMPDGNVMLDIDFRQASLAHQRGVINRDTTQTRLQIPLGRWTALSNIDQNRSSSVNTSSFGLPARQQESRSSSTPLEILVEELP
jgi:type II secretory pathway component GspD/PulD (secretin)